MTSASRRRTSSRTRARACPATACTPAYWVWDGKRLPGAINVGVRPTFKEGAPPLCEIYVLDFDGDLYGEQGEVEFVAFLRPEERFDSGRCADQRRCTRTSPTRDASSGEGSMTDTASVATDLIAQLEAGDGAAVWAQLDEAIQAKVPVEKFDDVGRRRSRAGSASRGGSSTPRSGRSIRTRIHVWLAGERPGRCASPSVATTTGRMTGIAADAVGERRDPQHRHRVSDAVSGTRSKQRVDGEPRQLGEFYAELLGGRIIRDDWIKVAVDAAAFPHLAFGDGWSDERPARWDDPDVSAAGAPRRVRPGRRRRRRRARRARRVTRAGRRLTPDRRRSVRARDLPVSATPDVHQPPRLARVVVRLR